MNEREARLGIDIGRVLITPGDGQQDTAFFDGSLERALETPPYPDMFDVVPQLVDRFSGRAWLVSKAGPRIEDRTRRWLDHHRFFARTGLARDNVRFCRDRPGKVPICRELGLTHYIDDRLDILTYMRGVVPQLYWFGANRDGGQHWLVPLRGWPEALDQVRPDR